MFNFMTRKNDQSQGNLTQDMEIRSVSNLWTTLFSATDTVTDVTAVSTAYSCIKLLSESVAQTPLVHILETDDGEETLKTSAITRLIREPTNDLSYFKWMRNMVQDMIGYGNGYSVIQRNPDGSVFGLLFLKHNQVQIYRTLDPLFPYYYQCTNYGESFKVFPEDMLHFSNITSDGINGMSPLAVHRKTFAASNSISDYNITFMDNATNLSGVIHTEKAMSKEQRADTQKGFKDQFSGTVNAGGTPVLPHGLQYTQLKPISPLDSEYIQNKQLNDDEIAKIFGVPPSILNGTGSGDAEQNALWFQQYSVSPLYDLIEQEMSLKLIPVYKQSKQRTQFKPNSIKLSSNKEKADTLSLLKNSSIVTPNEAREFYGYKSLPGGDKLQDVVNAEQVLAGKAVSVSTVGQAVGDSINAPKNTDSTASGTGTNSTADTPRTDSNNQPSSKRALEEANLEIQRLKSSLGRLNSKDI